MEGLIHISIGGPVQKISCRGKIFTFEWHSYCGPIVLKKNGDEAPRQPNYVLKAASRWNQQGRRMENDLCVYDVPGEPILQHIVGRQYKVVGTHPDKRGS